MTEPETRMILSQVSAVDNRRLTDAVVMMWYTIFAGYTYGEVKWAVLQHFRTSTDYLMPAHITEIIHLKRLEYRMMNPSARIDKDDWLSFENEQEQVASFVRELRASGARSAIEAANDPELDS